MEVPRGLIVVFVIFVQVYLKYHIDVEDFIRNIEVKKPLNYIFCYVTFFVIFCPEIPKTDQCSEQTLELGQNIKSLLSILFLSLEADLCSLEVIWGQEILYYISKKS